jgi:hypothetical protein
VEDVLGVVRRTAAHDEGVKARKEEAMKTYSIFYEDEVFLHNGQSKKTMLKCGTLEEADNGSRTIRMDAYPGSVFYVRDEGTKEQV